MPDSHNSGVIPSLRVSGTETTTYNPKYEYQLNESTGFGYRAETTIAIVSKDHLPN
jgi:uncharacterized protein YggE